jgi:hypothetical protein
MAEASDVTWAVASKKAGIDGTIEAPATDPAVGTKKAGRGSGSSVMLSKDIYRSAEFIDAVGRQDALRAVALALHLRPAQSSPRIKADPAYDGTGNMADDRANRDADADRRQIPRIFGEANIGKG